MMPIRKTKKGYKIDNVDKTFPTREKAVEVLRAIKASQRAKKKGRKARGK